jgi:hypothetical protein
MGTSVVSLADMFFRGQLVEVLDHCIHNFERPLRTFAEAGPEAVAVLLRDQSGLTVDDPDGPFGARRDTETAAVAFFLIDFYDFPGLFHIKPLSFALMLPLSHGSGKSALT